MDLLGLQIPATFEEICSIFRDYYNEKCNQWEFMSYDQLNSTIQQYFNSLNQIKTTTDPKNLIRYAIGVGVLTRIQSNFSEKLFNDILSRFPIQDNLASEFVCYMLANFCRKSYQRDFSYINKLISFCSDGFSQTTNRFRIRNSVQLLNRLCIVFPSTIKNNAQQYIEVLITGIIKQHADIRLPCFKILAEFIEKMQNGMLIVPYIVSAKYTLFNTKSPDREQSSLLILSLAAHECPELVTQDAAKLMETAYSFISHKQSFLQASGLRLLISLAPLEPVLYRTKYSENVAKLMFQSGKLNFAKLSTNVIARFPDTLSMFSTDIAETCRKMILSNNSNYLEAGFAILCEFSISMPLEFGARIYEISDCLSQASITKEYANYAHQLFEKSNKLWRHVQNALVQKILQEIPTKPLLCLKLLSECPKFYKDNSLLLYEPVKKLIDHKSVDIRCIVPKVLVSLVLDRHSQLFVDTAQIILDHTLCEQISYVRYCAVDSFQDDDLGVLALPQMLPFFQILVNDESFEVRKCVYKLLTKIECYNPMMILPLFRSTILESVQCLSYTTSLIQQARNVFGSSIILRSAKSILPIYAPILTTAILEFLNSKILQSSKGMIPKRPPKLTFFEKQSIIEIAQSAIDSLGLITSLDSKLLEDNITEIIPLFINILSIETSKKVFLSVLNAIMLFIDTYGLGILDKYPKLIDALYDFGSKTQSTTLRSVLFKILGKIGSIQPSIIRSDEWEVYDKLGILGTSISYADWYLQVTAQALLDLLKSEGRSDVHYKAQEILSVSLHSNSDQIRPLFDKFIYQLLSDVYKMPLDEAPRYFTLLSSVIKHHSDWLKPFAEEFSNLLKDMFDTCFLDNILELLPNIIECFGELFNNYIAKFMPKLTSLLSQSLLENPTRCFSIIDSFVCLTKYSSDFTFLLIELLISTASNKQIESALKIKCLNAITLICIQNNCTRFSSSIFRLFTETLISTHDESVKKEAFSMVNTFEHAFGMQFPQFNIGIHSFLQIHNIPYQNASLIMNEAENEPPEFYSSTLATSIDENGLIQQTKSDNILTSNEWKEWSNNFILSFISMSPVQVINSCSWIAFANSKFALKIFYAAFLSCWSQISEATRRCISTALLHCFEEQSTPISIIVTFVDLAEFMERAEQHLLISYIHLARAARRAKKFSFSLYCLTKELQKPPANRSNATYEALVDIFAELSLYEDMYGFIKFMQPDHQMTPYLAEKLHDWKLASELYEKDEKKNLPNLLNAYVNLQKYDEIADYFKQFDNFQSVVKAHTALSFSKAFLYLNNFQSFEKAIAYAPNDSIGSVILKAMGNATHGRPVDSILEEGFEMLAHGAGPLFSHSFSSIEPYIVSSQQLVEIGEFAKKDFSRWRERSKRDNQSIKIMKPLYDMRILLLDPSQRNEELINFLKKLRKNGDWQTHSVYFQTYLKDFNIETADPLLVLEYIYQQAKINSKMGTLPLLDKLIQRLEPGKILNKALFKKALFSVRIGSENQIPSTLHEVSEITRQIPNRKAQSFFAWAQIRLYNMREGDRATHAIAAIRAFTKCILTDTGTRLPEIQQLTSIIFRSGKYSEVFKAVKDDLKVLPVAKWISVVPQLFSQLDNPVKEINQFIIDILSELLEKHRHAVLFYLLFSINGGSDGRSADDIYNDYKKKEPELVKNTKMFFDGLCRACTTRIEIWADTLNSVTGPIKQNNMKMIRCILNPMIEEMNYPVTDDDRAFAKEFGFYVKKLSAALRDYLKNPKKETLEELWRQCKELFTIVKHRIDQTIFLDVPSVAPDLAKVKDIPIAVPGTYHFNKPLITISLVGRSMEVLRSKQHPKKLCVRGSNGQEFWYLLKGREDLRLDQRAMQMFSLINAFIPEQANRIITYYVMPISTNAGLIEWINSSSTLAKIIRDYRTANGEPVEKETKMMSQLSIQPIDSLLPIQRYEMLNEVSQLTSDSDLANIIWLKSSGSESWLMKTQTFCHTASVMSIAGYLLGLGDRHPSNIMINIDTGTIIHIDLGDCFEVTKERMMFPELIPFRLTRFMIRAFGPCGAKGSFHAAAQNILKIIRNRKESLMAILEIFVYSPLSSENKSIKRETETSISALLEVSEKNEDIIKPLDSKPIRRIARIANKLSGREFGEKLGIEQQVTKLVELATDYYNLAHLYRGWNPLW